MSGPVDNAPKLPVDLTFVSCNVIGKSSVGGDQLVCVDEHGDSFLASRNRRGETLYVDVHLPDLPLQWKRMCTLEGAKYSAALWYFHPDERPVCSDPVAVTYSKDVLNDLSVAGKNIARQALQFLQQVAKKPSNYHVTSDGASIMIEQKNQLLCRVTFGQKATWVNVRGKKTLVHGRMSENISALAKRLQ